MTCLSSIDKIFQRELDYSYYASFDQEDLLRLPGIDIATAPACGVRLSHSPGAEDWGEGEQDMRMPEATLKPLTLPSRVPQCEFCPN
jgi:hypothetical protein